MSRTDHSLTTSDGVSLAYSDEGEGKPFVLVHGYASNRSHFEYQRAALAGSSRRAISLDLRGHGDSETPRHGQNVARLGQDLRELLEHLDLHDVTLVGHSMGVSVSLAMFSISGFDRIGRFISIDQSPKIVNDDNWGWGVKGVNWSNLDDCVNFRIKWSNEELEPALPEDSAMAKEPWSEFDDAAVSRLLLSHFVSDWRDVLPRIPVPTWVVTSRHTNYYYLAGMEWFAREVPNARLTVFEESGHNPHVSEADEFNRELLAFVDANS